jgi:hypothetical protein
MNYTLKDADKICVGDTLTLEDGTVHEAVKDEWKQCRVACSFFSAKNPPCFVVKCEPKSFHFKQIKP